MRILSVIHHLAPGGMQRVTQNNAEAFSRRGHASAVFAHRGGGALHSRLTGAGIPVFIGGDSEEEFERGLDQAVAFRPSLIWLHGSGAADARLARIVRTIRSALGQPVPAVLTSHFSRPDHSPDRDLIDIHVQISEWGMWRWRQWTSLQRPRPIGVVVPHLIATDAFAPITAVQREVFRSQHGIPLDAVLFGRLGQPNPEIWPRALLATFAQFAHDEPRAWLLLVGSPPAMANQRERLPAHIASRVVLLPFLQGDDLLRNCYGALDAFLHITRIGDTFGLVLCESMLCGTPVLTVATPAKSNGHVEIVGHGVGGMVCANLGEVPPALGILANDASLRARLGAQGRERILRLCDRERLTDLNLAIAETLLRSESRAALERLLAAIPGLATDVPATRVRELTRNVLGSYTLTQRVGAWLVGDPRMFAAWMRLRSLLFRSTS